MIIKVSFWRAQAAVMILLLLGDSLGQKECSKPLEYEVLDILANKLSTLFSDGSFTANITAIYSLNYTCLAVRALDKYEFVSVAVHYQYFKQSDAVVNTTLIAALHQFEMQCKNYAWTGGDDDTLEPLGGPVPSTQFCASCITDGSNPATDDENLLHNCYRKQIYL